MFISVHLLPRRADDYAEVDRCYILYYYVLCEPVVRGQQHKVGHSLSYFIVIVKNVRFVARVFL